MRLVEMRDPIKINAVAMMKIARMIAASGDIGHRLDTD
jgi:hypothetical protein